MKVILCKYDFQTKKKYYIFEFKNKLAYKIYRNYSKKLKKTILYGSLFQLHVMENCTLLNFASSDESSLLSSPDIQMKVSLWELSHLYLHLGITEF